MADVDEKETTVRLVQEEGYRFVVEPDDSRLSMTVDEPPPLGTGRGPNAARLLATAVGHCLSSSLLFCLQKARVTGVRLATEVRASMRRNERGRWRIAGLQVQIHVTGLDRGRLAAFERCRGLFEDYCTVTGSVRLAIPVEVAFSGIPEAADRAA